MFHKFAIFLILACSFSAVLSAPIQRLELPGDINGEVEALEARQNNGNGGNPADCPPVTITMTITVEPPTATPAPPISEGNAPASQSGNLQPFAGALGSQRAPAVKPGGRGFQVENNASFDNLTSALNRSCDVQKNLCANVANSGAGRASGLTVAQCEEQGNQCRAGIPAAAASPQPAAPQAPAPAPTAPPVADTGANAPAQAPANDGGNTAATPGNLQPFAGALGGQKAPTVTPGGRGFQVENNASFPSLQSALQRSCDVQKNLCANVANSAAGRTSGLTVGQCDQQGDQCRAGIAGAAANPAAQPAPAQNQNNQAANPPAASANNGNNGTASNGNASAASGNLQPFAGALGGETAPAVIPGGRGFQVEGNASFLDLASALRRSCDVQKNKCANVANSAVGRTSGFTVGQCDQQGVQCRAGIQ